MIPNLLWKVPVFASSHLFVCARLSRDHNRLVCTHLGRPGLGSRGQILLEDKRGTTRSWNWRQWIRNSMRPCMEDTRQNVEIRRAVRQSGCNNVARIIVCIKTRVLQNLDVHGYKLMYEDKFDHIASQTTCSTTTPYPYTHPHYPPIRAWPSLKLPLKHTQSVRWHN